MRYKPTTIRAQLAALEDGTTGAMALLDDTLQKAAAPDALSVYTHIFDTTARAEATAVDLKLAAGVPAGPLAGLPIAIKDLFDVSGRVTHAGSKLFYDNSPAASDATVVARLRAAGAVLVGHANMTEFAYSGLGINPHYGTPANPFDNERVPGGSSSGSAAAVACGAAAAGLATDTGGSVRIPAAFCGLTGFKPTQNRVPRDGAFPLSTTLDSIGPIAPSVDCCARLDAVLSGEPWQPPRVADIRGLRLAVADNIVLDDLDDTVAVAFERALQALSGAGAVIDTMHSKPLDQTLDLDAGGGFSAAESYRCHRAWLADKRALYDPRVASRIEPGRDISAADYLDLCDRRVELMRAMDRFMAGHDALVMPTAAVVPPRLADVASETGYVRANKLVLRNTALANLLGLCAISLPCHQPGELPVGLMLVGRAGTDHALLDVAASVEKLLQSTQADNSREA